MKGDQTKTVLICDDEARTRQALKALLFTREIARTNDPSPVIQVIGEASHGAEAVRMVEILQPEVVVWRTDLRDRNREGQAQGGRRESDQQDRIYKMR